jgi:hypothetical protein
VPDWLIWLIATPILLGLLIAAIYIFVLAVMFVSRLLDLASNFSLYGTPKSPYEKKETTSSGSVSAKEDETDCVRIDPDLLEFFSAREKSCESMINEVLRQYVDSHKL